MHKKYRLLVIDSNSAFTELLQVYLKNSFLSHAYSIEEAKFHLLSYDFDLILIHSIYPQATIDMVTSIKGFMDDFIPILSLTKTEGSKSYKIVAEVTLKAETMEHISDSILKVLCLLG